MPQAKTRIGLLTLLFDWYLRSSDSMLHIQREFAQKLVDRMGEFGDVVFPDVCTNRDQVTEAVRQFDAEKADIIVVVFLSYVPSLYSLPPLQRTQRPVLIFNTQKLYAVTQELQPRDTSENHGMHGVQDLANVLLRAGRPFQLVTGFWEDDEVMAEVQAWCDAARVCRVLSQSRVGLLGYAMESMGDFGVDETAFLAQVGVHVNHLPMQLVATRAAEAPQSEVDAQMAFDRQHFQVSPDVTPEQHETASRLEWALRDLLRERNLTGFAAHFLAIGEEQILGMLPFLAACKLLGEGYGYGGEGDVTSAVAVSLLHELVGEANFTEMFTMDFGGGTALMSHMGEGNWRMAHPDYPPELVTGRREGSPVTIRFTARPGPVTLLSLTTVVEGRFRFIIAEGEVVDAPPIPNVGRVHFKFKPNQPLPQFLTRFSEAGGSHHQGMAYGHVASTLVKVAKLMGVDWAVI
jgi:L-arabinose isomerase